MAARFIDGRRTYQSRAPAARDWRTSYARVGQNALPRGSSRRCQAPRFGVLCTEPTVLGEKRIAVVVPAYNEARLLPKTLASVPGFVDVVIVVDDASSDATAAAAAGAGDPRVCLERHPENRGVGAAIATGYRAALSASCDVVAVMAGDAQMHPDDLRVLLDPVLRGHADYSKGDRFSHPDVRTIMPAARRRAGIALSWLTRHAAGLARLSDSQCGYTAISRAALERIDLELVYPRYGYPNDLLGHLARAGCRICDVPVRPVYAGEASGVRPWHVAVILALLARVAYRRLVMSETPRVAALR